MLIKKKKTNFKALTAYSKDDILQIVLQEFPMAVRESR